MNGILFVRSNQYCGAGALHSTYTGTYNPCLYRYRTFTIIPVLDPVTEKNRIMFFSFLKEGNAKTKIVGFFLI